VQQHRDRQKMIRLADTSENGWGAVDQYKGNDCANDEEDNQKMAKSDRSAGVKRRQMAAQRGPSRQLEACEAEHPCLLRAPLLPAFLLSPPLTSLSTPISKTLWDPWAML